MNAVLLIPFSEKSIFLEVFLFLSILPSSSHHPFLSDLLTDRQKEDKVRRQKVTRPLVNPVTFLWHVFIARFIGNSIGCCAVPIPDQGVNKDHVYLLMPFNSAKLYLLKVLPCFRFAKPNLQFHYWSMSVSILPSFSLPRGDFFSFILSAVLLVHIYADLKSFSRYQI